LPKSRSVVRWGWAIRSCPLQSISTNLDGVVHKKSASEALSTLNENSVLVYCRR
jgi:hypothetical protein